MLAHDSFSRRVGAAARAVFLYWHRATAPKRGVRAAMAAAYLAAAAACVAGTAAAAPGAAPPSKTSAQAKNLDALAQEWRTLRPQHGHFDGAPWNEAVDRFGGRKHVLLQALSDGLLREQASPARWESRLGAPDAVLRPGSAAHRATLARLQAAAASGPAPHSGATLWLYNWRGQHDRLALLLNQGRIERAIWLLEGE